MSGKIYYCVCEDWSERITVNNFGGRTMKQERGYALTMYKTCHRITTDHASAQRIAKALREQIARNRAAQAPQIKPQPQMEERHLDEQAGGNPPIDIIDPEQTMTAQQIRAALRGW